MKYGHGEYIPLFWDYSEPEFEICKGHITKEEFIQAMLDQGHNPDVIGDDDKVLHRQARWVPAHDKCYDMKIVIEKNQKRGNFPVTLI